MGEKITNPLLEDVKKWSDWVLKMASNELSKYYPVDSDGSKSVGYIWSNTVKCTNPACGVDIPLVKQTWLANGKSRKIAYRIVPNGSKKYDVLIYEGNGINFDPKEGTVSRAKVVCPCCHTGLTDREVRKQFLDGLAGQRMMVVVLNNPKGTGKIYRKVSEADLKSFLDTNIVLKRKREEINNKWGLDPIPTEPTPEGNGSGAERAFSLRTYGMNVWVDRVLCESEDIVFCTGTHADCIRMKYSDYAKLIEPNVGRFSDLWGAKAA